MATETADPRAQAIAAIREKMAEATGAAPKPKEPPPPPEVDRDAPHGRDPETGEALAPYGRNKDGRPALSKAGRKAKDPDDKARLAKDGGQPGGDGGGAKQLEPKDYAGPLMEAGETLWFAGSMAAKLAPQIPVIGKLVPGPQLAATMAVFDAERPRLAAALDLAAQHDERARALAERLSGGGGAWTLTCMLMVLPFAATVAAIWQTSDKHDVLKERGLPGLDDLVAANNAALDRAVAKISDRMTAAQAAGQADLPAAA